MKITNFHYSNMKMPDPSPSEYPKWVYMDGYPGILADDAEHEAALLARPTKSKTDKPIIIEQVKPETMAEKPAHILSGPNDEREILLQIAKEKNIKVDARWKTDRIRATIERETQGQ
jgi:hypothetical protein